MNDQPTRILLIEDDPTYAKLLRTCLDRHASGFRFQLEVAGSLKAGLARLAGGGIDIILSDLGLPDSQELETLKRLHKRVPDLPIIVLSGVDDPTMEMQAIHHGAEEYLVAAFTRTPSRASFRRRWRANISRRIPAWRAFTGTIRPRN
jgi:DNA-binding NtrC family response regulator